MAIYDITIAGADEMEDLALKMQDVKAGVLSPSALMKGVVLKMLYESGSQGPVDIASEIRRLGGGDSDYLPPVLIQTVREVLRDFSSRGWVQEVGSGESVVLDPQIGFISLN